MNNNYDYVERVKKNKEEQEKLKEELRNITEIIFLTEEEKEKIIDEVLADTLKSYKQNNILSFQLYLKNKLRKEIEKKYFSSSTIIPMESQKIINLYLTKRNNKFLTEKEIREKLQTNSGTLYQAIATLSSEIAKVKKELLRIFPNYKQQLKERRAYFKQPSVLSVLSEKDLRYLGYYLGEIEDICLDIPEIAIKEGKSTIEIEKELKKIFDQLTDENNLKLVKERYPGCEKMLQIKATNFGIKLYKEKHPKPKKQKPTSTKSKKKKPLLTEVQETILKELAKNPNITNQDLANLMGYKSPTSIWTTIGKIKKKCEKNEEVKKRVLELYPDFLKPREEQKTQQTMEKKEKPLLTEKQETILKELAKNPNIKKTELGNLVGYKSKNSIWTTLRAIKKKCEKNEEVKKRVLELYPDFLKPREEQKTQQTMEKKVKPLLTEKQETILKELAKNPNIKKPALGKLAGFKNSYSIYRALKELKKKYEEDKKTKEAILKLYPDFLKPKEKKEKSCSPPLQNKKRNRKKRKGGELPPSQQKLLEILKKRNTISITDPETIKKLGYSSPKTIYNTISNIRIKCQKNADFKKQVLKIYPEFLTPQKKLSLSEKELQILQSLYLVTPPQTAYLSQTQVAKKFKCSQPIIFKEKEKALRKIAQSEEIKTKLEEIWPTFDQDRIIKEQYKISRSVKMPREDVEGIKDLISQFNSQENKTEKPKSPILTGIKNLEESIFSPYVSQCTEEQKAMLALRLGFINAPSTTETVAKLFNVEQQEVITLTKNCLQSVKSLLEEKPPQKKKGELRKS